MKKTAMAVLAMTMIFAQGAFAAGRSQSVQIISNIESTANRVDARMDQLTEYETNKLDAITSAAAARAVLALRCEGGQFERVSRVVQTMMESKIALVSDFRQAANAYAKDSAQMKYKAMLVANTGAPCSELGRLRDIAASQGFDE